jgi:ubiquinone biosynthesis protein COQ9
MSTSQGEEVNAPATVGKAFGQGYPAPMSEIKSDWASEAEQRLLDAAIVQAPNHGWTAQTIRLAARDAGMPEADAKLLLPNGPSDLAALLSRRHDADAFAALADLDPRSVKVRERIYRAVQARVEAAAKHEAASRRLMGFLALPHHMALGARLLWESADVIWRWAGDTATDENHYSKRAILSGVLAPAIAIRLASGRAAADEYVFRRIADVMAFEKWKAGLPKTDIGFQLAGALGKLRYGLKPNPQSSSRTDRAAS